MEGKYSLKHLYNNGKSSQMKPLEFIDLMNWLDQNADGMIGDAVEVTEKIDGSSNFIGYDGRIYVEKFGFDKKFYDESDFDNPFSGAKARALLDFAHSIPELPDYLEDLCNDNNCASVKIQIEVLMTKFSKAPDVCQVVLVPYELNKLGKDGSGFIIQVLNGDTLKPVVDEKIAVDTLCDIMSSDNFHVTGTNPKQFTPIDIKEDIQEVKNIIADYTESMGKSVEEILTSRKRSEAEMKKALKAEIENIQEALQDKLSEAFPVGDYGEYYEGLVFKLTNGMMFKVTSKKFKQFMAEHNHWTEGTIYNKPEMNISQSSGYINKKLQNTLLGFFQTENNTLDTEAIDKFISCINIDYEGKYIGFQAESKTQLSIKTIEFNTPKIKDFFIPQPLTESICKSLFKKLKLEFQNTSYNVELRSSKHIFIDLINNNILLKDKPLTLSLKLSQNGGGLFETIGSRDEKGFNSIITSQFSNGLDLNYLASQYTSDLNSTSIQEAITGVVIESIAKDEFNIKTPEQITQKIRQAIKNLNDFFEDNPTKLVDNIGIKSILNGESNNKETQIYKDISKVNDYVIKGLTKSAIIQYFDKSWEDSLVQLCSENIAAGNAIKEFFNNEDSLSRTFVLHPTLQPLNFLKNENNEDTQLLYDTIKTLCMDSHYVDVNNKSIKRDLVNPSDIYFIDKSLMKQIIESFDELDLKKTRLISRQEYINWHDKATKDKCLLGISLKKLNSNSHINISGSELEIGDIEKKVFFIDLLNPDNSTLSKNSLCYTWAASPNPSNSKLASSPRCQGQFTLYAKCKEPIGEVSLTIRSNGNSTPTIEVKHLGASAQGGKGKDEITSLLEVSNGLKTSLGKLAFKSLLDSNNLKKILEAQVASTKIPEQAIPIFKDSSNKCYLCKTKYKDKDYFFLADKNSKEKSGLDDVRNPSIEGKDFETKLQGFTVSSWWEDTNVNKIFSENSKIKREESAVDHDILLLSSKVIKALKTKNNCPFTQHQSLFNKIAQLPMAEDIKRIACATILYAVCFKYPITFIADESQLKKLDIKEQNVVNDIKKEAEDTSFGKDAVSYLKFG